MPLDNWTATTDYEVRYPHPIELTVGEIVKAEKADPIWPDWIWVTNQDGSSGWVPRRILSIHAPKTAEVNERYSGKEMSVCKGEQLRCLREEGGWFWAAKSSGEEGWIPEFVLRRLQSSNRTF